MTKNSITVVIAGGTGFVGGELARQLREAGHHVRILSRRPRVSSDPEKFQWKPDEGWIDPAVWEGAQAVVFLAGVPIADKRWTKKQWQAICHSRLNGTQVLAAQAAAAGVRHYVGTSALARYLPQGDAPIDEASPTGGDSKLARLAADWEAATLTHAGDMMTTIIRIGLVLGPHGGFIQGMKAATRFGIWPVMGTGKEWMPWIHLEDQAAMFRHVITEQIPGMFNGSGPRPMQNKELMASLRRKAGKPGLLLRFPSPLVRIMFGEMSEALLASQNVRPSGLTRHGFDYAHLEV